MPTATDNPVPSAVITSSSLGNGLLDIMSADTLQPGDTPSWQVARAIYLYHPLGGKIAESPIRMAQSQEREITVAGAPEKVAERFKDQWSTLGASGVILNTMTQARVYGLSSVAVGVKKDETRLLEEANKWIAANLKNGRLDAIYKKYHGNGLPDVILNQ